MGCPATADPSALLDAIVGKQGEAQVKRPLSGLPPFAHVCPLFDQSSAIFHITPFL